IALFLVGSLLAGAGALAQPTPPGSRPRDDPPPPPKAAKPAERPGTDRTKGDDKVVRVRGRVLGPDGKPFAGAKLNLGHYGPGGVTFSVRATSGQDGSFDFTFNRTELSKARSDRPVDPWEERGGFHPVSVGNLVAVADGHGADWARVDRLGP